MTGVENFAVAAEEVEATLAKWQRGYRNNYAADPAYSHVPVMPYLWSECQAYCGLPDPDDLVQSLIEHPGRTPGLPEMLYEQRATKLTQDFLRDLHTYSLLLAGTGGVFYKGAVDLDDGVDFECRAPWSWSPAIPRSTVFGVQATMRANWAVMYSEVKADRQERRRAAVPGHRRRYEHPVFLLSNRDDGRMLNAGGVWLFTPAQISDFLQSVRGYFAEEAKGSA